MTKKYAQDGYAKDGCKPLYLRLNEEDRSAWEALKTHKEAQDGQSMSHSLFAALVIREALGAFGCPGNAPGYPENK